MVIDTTNATPSNHVNNVITKVNFEGTIFWFTSNKISAKMFH